MLVLAIDAAGYSCSVGIVADGYVLAGSIEPPNADGRSPTARLAPMVVTVLGRADVAASALDMIAVIVGPGGFTGIRAALALAHGIALAIRKPVVGVTVGEAIGMEAQTAGRRLLVATDSRRGRFFLERDGTVETFATPPPERGPVAIAGNAAVLVMSSLAARGADVMLLEARGPSARGIAAAAVARNDGLMPPRDAQPLYVDPPEARLPLGGSRPAPVGVAG